MSIKLKFVIFLLMILICLGGLAGCGHKGPPVPPPEESVTN